MIYSELLDFQGGTNSGAAPSTGVVFGSPGELFGTTQGGGHGNFGTVYRLTPTLKPQFFSIAGGNQGAVPNSNLAVDRSAGVLYGCCTQSGSLGHGVVFSLTLPGGALAGAAYHVLVAFDGVTNGSLPLDVVLGPGGVLYGVTNGAQATNMVLGTVFTFDPATRAFNTLHVFSGTDGAYPNLGLIFDAAGNCYGTTNEGGASSVGTVFSIAPDGTFTSLASFPGSPAGGAYPAGGLTLDPATGTLYGMTNGGGKAGVGAVFSLSRAGVLTTLHSFNALNLQDGNSPVGGVVLDTRTHCLYGTSQLGGGPTGAANGTIFRLTLPANHLTVLHTFTDPKDGANPIALTNDSQYHLYGTTNTGGSANLGVVFKLA